jgi:hypothetical protein
MIPFASIVPDSCNQVYSRDALSIQSLSQDAATLCPELIYEILTYCLSGVTLSAGAPGLFPWYLGHICQSRRSVFTSSPRFWDRFTFEASGRMEMATISRLERALALVELCPRHQDGTVAVFIPDFGKSSCPCGPMARMSHSRYRWAKEVTHQR